MWQKNKTKNQKPKNNKETEFGEGSRKVFWNNELASRLKIFDVIVKYTSRDVQE